MGSFKISKSKHICSTIWRVCTYKYLVGQYMYILWDRVIKAWVLKVFKFDLTVYGVKQCNYGIFVFQPLFFSAGKNLLLRMCNGEFL